MYSKQTEKKKWFKFYRSSIYENLPST